MQCRFEQSDNRLRLNKHLSPSFLPFFLPILLLCNKRSKTFFIPVCLTSIDTVCPDKGQLQSHLFLLTQLMAV